MTKHLHKRYMALYLPHLAIDRLNRIEAEPITHPLALTRRVQNRVSLVCVNSAAERQGLQPGMVLATARAICSALDVRDDDPGADTALMERLANWASRYSPSLAIDGNDGLILDITGCAHLFNGEMPMLKAAINALRQFGFSCQGAIADTPGAAWALSRFGDGQTVTQKNDTSDALRLLPVTALRMDAGTIEGLRLMGLKTLGDLYALPRSSLASRYGLELAGRLDKILGLSPDPIKPRLHKKPMREELRFPEPIGTADSIAGALRVLLDRLCQHLDATDQGCRRLILNCIRADNSSQYLEIGTASPNRTPDHLFQLFQEKLTQVEPRHGIDAMELSAPIVETFIPQQDGISLHLQQAETETLEKPTKPTKPMGNLSVLIDNLENRLGEKTVGVLHPVQSHLPERAQSWKPVSEIHLKNIPSQWPPMPERPLQLLKSPEPLFNFAQSTEDHAPTNIHCQGHDHHVKRAWGPERISANWWRQDPSWKQGARDYYRVQVETGQHYWIYREIQHNKNQWYLHGLFA